MKNIITLFDMDGTLTEPRQSFDKSLITVLSELADVSDIGIVSGSDYNYILEQMHYLMYKTSLRYQTHLFPCNGTKYYTPPEYSSDGFELIYEVDMSKKIGEKCFKDLMSYLLKKQNSYTSQLPCLSGHFVDYRGSMINWCPIGREANQKQREAFVQWDTSFNFRSVELLALSNLELFKDNDIVVKLGGDTSFDIFPKNWDKTYCLKHLEGYDEVYFVGDRCSIGGNDKELYDLLQPTMSHCTTGPSKTKKIIKSIISKIEDKV